MCLRALSVAVDRGSKIEVQRFSSIIVFTGDTKTFKKQVEKHWWETRRKQIKELIAAQFHTIDVMFSEEQGIVTGIVDAPEDNSL